MIFVKTVELVELLEELQQYVMKFCEQCCLGLWPDVPFFVVPCVVVFPGHNLNEEITGL